MYNIQTQAHGHHIHVPLLKSVHILLNCIFLARPKLHSSHPFTNTTLNAFCRAMLERVHQFHVCARLWGAQAWNWSMFISNETLTYSVDHGRANKKLAGSLLVWEPIYIAKRIAGDKEDTRASPFQWLPNRFRLTIEKQSACRAQFSIWMELNKLLQLNRTSSCGENGYFHHPNGCL